MDAGFQVSEYWMPGLGGKAMTEQHAQNTARVLNAVNPHYIRSRPFRPIAGTPMADQVRSGEVELLSPKEQLVEIRNMVRALEVTAKVCFDHAGNFWRTRSGELVFTHDYEGYQFPADKAGLLDRIDEGLAWDQPRTPLLSAYKATRFRCLIPSNPTPKRIKTVPEIRFIQTWPRPLNRLSLKQRAHQAHPINARNENAINVKVKIRNCGRTG